MNRVGGVGGNSRIASSSARPASPPAHGFSVASDPTGPERLEETRAAQPVGLAAMLALQEAESDRSRDRQGRRHGVAMLEALRELQLALLADGEAAAGPLARLAAQSPDIADSRLAAALAAIRLRAKIELLRRGVENA